MIRILSIETSTVVCSVAIHEDGICAHVSEIAEPNAHSAILTVLIEDLLKKQNLTINDFNAIAISAGPGSFTGLRIGASVAKGLCYACSIPLIAVDTLKALALQAKEIIETQNDSHKNVVLYPMIDARRMEVFTAEYTLNLECNKETFAMVVTDQTIEDFKTNNHYYFFGDGSEKLTLELSADNITYIPNIQTSAKTIGTLAFELYNSNSFADLAYFEPFYLKEFQATTPRKNILG